MIEMPKIRKDLITSALLDLRDLLKVTAHVESWSQGVYKTSTFSLMDYEGLVENINQRDTAGEQYITILEILHDKIYYFISVILNFIDSIPLVSDNNTSNVLPRTGMTLGTIITAVWNKLQDVRKGIARAAVEHVKCVGNIADADKASQTDLCALQQCASCSVAQSIIKQYINIVHGLFQYVHDEKISCVQQEQFGPEELLDVTDWVVMQRYTNAIESDLSYYVNEIRAFRDEQEALNTMKDRRIQVMSEEIQTLQDEVSACNMKIENYLKNKNHLELDLYKCKAKIDFDACERKKLEDENVSLQNYCAENAKLIKTICDLEVELQSNITKCNIVFKRFQETELHTETLILNNEKVEQMLNIHIAELKAQYNECQSMIAKLENYTEEKNNMIGELTLERNMLTERLKRSDDENKASLIRIQELEAELKEYERKFIVLLYNPDFFAESTAKRVECEPVRDMENQIEANKIRMELLDRQNNHLGIILEKLKTRSVTPKIS